VQHLSDETMWPTVEPFSCDMVQLVAFPVHPRHWLNFGGTSSVALLEPTRLHAAVPQCDPPQAAGLRLHCGLTMYNLNPASGWVLKTVCKLDSLREFQGKEGSWYFLK